MQDLVKSIIRFDVLCIYTYMVLNRKKSIRTRRSTIRERIVNVFLFDTFLLMLISSWRTMPVVASSNPARVSYFLALSLFIISSCYTLVAIPPAY